MSKVSSIEKIDGLFDPFASAIASGKVTMVIREELVDISKQELLLVSKDLAWGVVILGDPVEIPIEKFGDHAQNHRISENVRKRLWPGNDLLFGYPVKHMQAFAEPRLINQTNASKQDISQKIAEGFSELSVALPEFSRQMLRFATGPSEAIDFLKNSQRAARKLAGSFGVPKEPNKNRSVPEIAEDLESSLEKIDPISDQEKTTVANAQKFLMELSEIIASARDVENTGLLKSDAVFPGLKVPDPKFFVNQAKAGKPTGLLARLSKSIQGDRRYALVNETIKPNDDTRIWGIVKVEQGTRVQSLEDLGDRIESIDDVTAREFVTEKNFLYHEVEIVRSFQPPLKIGDPATKHKFASMVNIDADIEKREIWRLPFEKIDPVLLSNADDDDLVTLDNELHEFHIDFFADNDRTTAINTSRGDVSREDVVNAHIFVLRELANRGMTHDKGDDDPLDEETRGLDREAFGGVRTNKYAVVHHSGNKLGDEIHIQDVLPNFKSAVLRSPAVYLVGGLANHGKTKNDVDILIKGPLDEGTKHVLKFRIGRMLPPELSQRVQFIDEDDLGGPFTDHYELFDLVLVARDEFRLKEMRDVIQKQDDPLLDLPDKPKKVPAVLQIHTRGKSAHLDLRFKPGDSLSGWTISAQKTGAVADAIESPSDARGLIKGYDPDEGNDFLKPILAPNGLFAVPKARQPEIWLQVDNEIFRPGEVGATTNETGVIVQMESPRRGFRVQFGLQENDFHEYFLTGGQFLNGILFFRQLSGRAPRSAPGVETGEVTPTGNVFWRTFLSKNLLPSVLKSRTVKKGTMPADGHSAMPVSLMQQTPEEFRFWESKGKEAKKKRDALVESKFFTEDNLKMMKSGDIVRVERKTYLYVPGDASSSIGAVTAPSMKSDRSKTDKVGVFLRVPKSLSEKFPPKDGEDKSPPHATMLFVGETDATGFSKVKAAVREVAKQIEPFLIEMTDYGEFENREGQVISHMIPRAKGSISLEKIHEMLRAAVKKRGIDPGHYDGFKSHVTIAYRDPDSGPYDGPKPSGSFKAMQLEVWSFENTFGNVGVALGTGKEQRVTKSIIRKAETARFVLSWQFFKGQEVVRAGPTRQIFWLAIDDEEKGLIAFKLQLDPLSGEKQITALRDDQPDDELLTLEGDIDPGSRFNPTKATPSTIRIQDKGTVRIIEKRPGLMRLDIQGDKLKGSFSLVREEAGSDFWTFMADENDNILKQDSFIPPKSVAEEAARGLQLREEFGRGGTRIGLARANQLSDRESISLETIRRMKAFFDRHEDNKDTPPEEGNGKIAWLLWGGDSGRRWAESILRQIDSDNIQKSSQFIRLHKSESPEEERIAFGVVLEPEITDGQGDIISEEVIRDAAFGFMERFQNMGLMHREVRNQDIKILESWLTKTDFEISGRKIRKGTWMMTVRVLSDELWKKVKNGDLVGFSIGGLALSEPIAA